MKQIFQKMMRRQVQDDLNDLNGLVKKNGPKGGWINVIRRALGMSGYQLARRIGCTQANVTAFERREKTKNISLEALEKVAQSMNCRLVYFLLPNKPLDELVEEQARLVAKKRLRSIEHSMELEQQELSLVQKKQQEDDLVQELLEGSSRKLWEED